MIARNEGMKARDLAWLIEIGLDTVKKFANLAESKNEASKAILEAMSMYEELDFQLAPTFILKGVLIWIWLACRNLQM